MKLLVKDKLRTIGCTLKNLRRQITYSDGFINFLASLSVLVIACYTKTLKVRYYFHPDFLKLDRTKVFYAFWHGRQFLLVPSFGSWHISIMSDLSWAGEIQTRILSRFGYVVVRGSSKRKGAQALLSMKKVIKNGAAGGFALDGPSGPIYKSKPGIIFLAQKMGYPIIPLTASADRAWILKKTWCHYLLPKPFAKCYVAMGKPIWVVKKDVRLTSEELDRILIDWIAQIDRKVGRISSWKQNSKFALLTHHFQ